MLLLLVGLDSVVAVPKSQQFVSLTDVLMYHSVEMVKTIIFGKKLLSHSVASETKHR
jgi:hypothetical protein